MTIRTVLVDDEDLAIAELSEMLKPHGTVEVVATASQSEQAVELIEKFQPDLLFLDINMPGLNGFELLEKLSSTPEVIFVTAYDHHAIKAFQVNALDYLLKPLNPDRLATALERVVALKQSKESENGHERSIDLGSRIFIKDGEKCYFIAVGDIVTIESIGNYVRLHFTGGKALLHKSLVYMESRLPPKDFFRANRREMFNLRHIDTIAPYFNNSLKVRMRNGTEIELSQRRSQRFKELMGL